MIKYIILRITTAFATLSIILLVNFGIFFYLTKYSINYYKNNTHNTYFVNNNITATINTEILQHYNINNNFFKSYFTIIKNYIMFNFGYSDFYNQKIILLINQSIVNSFILALFSSVFIYLLAIIIAFIKLFLIYNKYFYTNNLLNFLLVIFYSIPLFALASLLNYYFGKSIILAIIANLLNSLLWFVMLFYNFLHQQINKTYFLFCLSKGYGYKSAFLKINLKNILLKIFSDFPSLFIGIFFASSIFLENIFNINGIALLFYKSIINYDYYLTLAIIYFIALCGIILRLLSDIIYYKLDHNFKIIK